MIIIEHKYSPIFTFQERKVHASNVAAGSV